MLPSVTDICCLPSLNWPPATGFTVRPGPASREGRSLRRSLLLIAAPVLASVLVASGLLPGSPPASASSLGGTVGSVSVSGGPGDAVNASGMQYQVGFTTSATGALSGDSLITVTWPAGTAFASTDVNVADVTTGQNIEVDAGVSGSALTFNAGLDIAGGDRVLLTIGDVTNGPDTGTNTLTVSTTSDTGTASGHYTLASPAAVLAAGATVSTQAPGQPANYTVTLTASPTGALAAGFGHIVLAAPAGTTFSAPGDYTINDLTAQQTGTLAAAVSNGGATVTLTTSIPVAAGDQVSVTAAAVTNPSATGDDTI